MGGAAWELNVLGGREPGTEASRRLIKAALTSGDPIPLIAAAGDAFDGGQISEAERLWEAARRLNSTEAKRRLAALHIERGDPPRALEVLDERLTASRSCGEVELTLRAEMNVMRRAHSGVRRPQPEAAREHGWR
jgi:hypothetical protein